MTYDSDDDENDDDNDDDDDVDNDDAKGMRCSPGYRHLFLVIGFTERQKKKREPNGAAYDTNFARARKKQTERSLVWPRNRI